VNAVIHLHPGAAGLSSFRDLPCCPLILRQAWAALDLRQDDLIAQLHRLCESIVHAWSGVLPAAVLAMRRRSTLLLPGKRLRLGRRGKSGAVALCYDGGWKHAAPCACALRTWGLVPPANLVRLSPEPCCDGSDGASLSAAGESAAGPLALTQHLRDILEEFAFAQGDEFHALGGAASFADLVHGDAYLSNWLRFTGQAAPPAWRESPATGDQGPRWRCAPDARAACSGGQARDPRRGKAGCPRRIPSLEERPGF